MSARRNWVEAVQRELPDRDEALQQLKQHLLHVQCHIKDMTNNKRVEKSFNIKEWVFSHAETS